jgi:hypothetical protein
MKATEKKSAFYNRTDVELQGFPLDSEVVKLTSEDDPSDFANASS